MAKRKPKRRETQERVERSADKKPEPQPERMQETQMPPEPMGDIFTPDRSGVSGIRDKARR